LRVGIRGADDDPERWEFDKRTPTPRGALWRAVLGNAHVADLDAYRRVETPRGRATFELRRGGRWLATVDLLRMSDGWVMDGMDLCESIAPPFTAGRYTY
jgi:hypothetical protein